jgi:hypothetical protein
LDEEEFLVCKKCRSYYELQPGESPDDFVDKCECGGNIYTSTSKPNEYTIIEDDPLDVKWDKKWKSRLEERKQERIRKANANKSKGIRSPAGIPWSLIITLFITVITIWIFGTFGLVFLLLYFLLKDL